MSLQDFFIYESEPVSGNTFTTNENYKLEIKEVYIVYKTTNLVNGKIYVGQHLIKNNLIEDGYIGSGIILKNAIKKYGITNFKRETIEVCYSKQETDEKEIYWIAQLSATNSEIGYNIANGGGCGDTFTNNPNKEEMRKRNKEWHENSIHIYNKESDIESIINKDQPIPDGWVRGRKPYTKEAKDKMSKARKGKTYEEIYGEENANEMRTKRSDANKGREKSLEERQNISKSKKGKKATPETIKILSESHKGKPSPKKGKKFKPLSLEHRKKISESLKKTIEKKNKEKENKNI